MKVNDFDFKALCDLDSSVSIMPRKIYDMLDLPPLEDCYLNVPLDDNVKNKLMESLNDVLIMVNDSYVPLISMFWMLNTMLLVLLLWEDLFLELLVPLLI